MTTETRVPEYEGWAVVELMGHRRLAGYVREAAAFGTALLRLDVPGEADPNCQHTRTIDNTSHLRCPQCGKVRYAQQDWKIEGDGAVVATQYYGGGSIYAITPCTEEIARALAKHTRETPEPIAYALPAPKRCDGAWGMGTPCSPDIERNPDDSDATICGRHKLQRDMHEVHDGGAEEIATAPAADFEPDDRD